MAKDFESLKQQALVIKNEVEDGANNTERVGGMLEDIVESMKLGTTEFNVSAFFPTGGTSGSNKYDLSTAIAQVPAELRTAGLTISFLNSAGDTEKWEFGGGSWTVGSFEQVGGNKISELKDEVATINTAINGIKIIASCITGEDLINDSAYWGLNFDIGYKLSDTPQSIKNYSGYVTEVKSGQVIKLKSINNTNIIPWAITDNQRLIVAKNDSFGTGSLESYTINIENDGYIYTNQNTATKNNFSLIIEEGSTGGLNKKVSDNSKSIENLESVINTGSGEEIVKNITSAELTSDSSYYALNIGIGSKAPESPLEISNSSFASSTCSF